MDNYKLRQIMAAKHRARSYEEDEGMARMLKAVRLKREQAAGVNEPGTLLVQHEVSDDEGHKFERKVMTHMAQLEEVKNVEGVRQGG